MADTLNLGTFDELPKNGRPGDSFYVSFPAAVRGVYVWDGAGWTLQGGAAVPVTFAQPGTLAVTTGTGRFIMPKAATIVAVWAVVGTAPTGAAIIVDVKKNGTTVFTTQANRPTIAAAATKTAAGAVPDVVALAAGDVLSVDIAQVGSTVAGADLTVVVNVQ